MRTRLLILTMMISDCYLMCLLSRFAGGYTRMIYFSLSRCLFLHSASWVAFRSLVYLGKGIGSHNMCGFMLKYLMGSIPAPRSPVLVNL
jgi:hypothetical protein